MEILGERIKYLRESKKFSMYKLSRLLEISDAAICKWENNINEPKATNIKALCEFFEVSSDYLLGLENEIGAKKYFAPISPEDNEKEKPAPLPQDEQEFLTMYRALPSYLKDSIFAELKGMYKGYLASKSEKTTRRA